MGLFDNDDLFTLDGGASWADPWANPGDGDAWFADEAQPSRAMEFDPRSSRILLISSRQTFLYPDAASFDPVSDPTDRALYAACEGRSVLRVSPIPAQALRQTPSLGLLEFAAILDA